MNFDLAMAEESNADSRSLYQSLLDAVIYSNGKKSFNRSLILLLRHAPFLTTNSGNPPCDGFNQQP